MTLLRRLLRDERGANMVEFAVALPVLVMFIWGIFQVGLIYQANAGMQHALGEAARFATIFPTPSDTAIRAKVTTRKFGTYNGTLGTLQITNNTVTVSGSGVSGGSTTVTVSKDLTLTYSQPTNFIFFNGPTVNLSKSKRVYLAT
jgi:Flp pilus assembly protein TadG